MKQTRALITKTKNILGRNITLSGYSDDGYYNNLIKKSTVYDEDLLVLLKTIAGHTKGKNILDVGANIGYVTCVLAKQFPEKKLDVFEPVGSNVMVLEKNIADNKLANVSVHPYGLANEEAAGSASWEPDNRGSAFITGSDQHEMYKEHEKVELKILDKERKNLNIKNCELIKVDIEGFELEFLRGANSFINEFKPVVVLEANHWCLNALQRITLPEFLDEILEIFPNVHGFWGNKVLDVREHTEIYMHENIVENRFLNLVCSFDKNQHQKILEAYKASARHLDYESALPVNVAKDLRNQIKEKESYEDNLRRAIKDQEYQLNILHNQQRDVRFLAKHLAKELQLRLNRRANTQTDDDGLIYKNSNDIKQKLENPGKDKAQLLSFIKDQDNQNINRPHQRGKARAYIKSGFWKIAAKIFNGLVAISKKIAGVG